MLGLLTRISAIGLMAGTLALGGCATTGSVERAQDTANQAMTHAQAGEAAAARAQGSADAAAAAAQGAATAAEKAQTTADAAVTDALKANQRLDTITAKVARLERQHRHGWRNAGHHQKAGRHHHHKAVRHHRKAKA